MHFAHLATRPKTLLSLSALWLAGFLSISTQAQTIVATVNGITGEDYSSFLQQINLKHPKGAAKSALFEG